ncbi:MAG: MBL fold metallo-hydrolase [Muribaculaceae bacterium]|nr:MBL fold metallo-hydrolase [Muribaculaceae bacterium]
MKIARFEFSLFGINTYVVWDPATRECAVVDPGMINAVEEKALADFIAREKLTVTHLINTHLHVDHAVGNRFVTETFDVPVEAHEADAVLGANLAQQAAMFGIAERVSDVKVGHRLEEGDVIHIGEGELKVLHVPGHSPGSVVLYDAKDDFLIAGDVLFRGSVGRADLPGGDMGTLISGIKGKLLGLPPQTVVYPGHGPATTIGEEKLMNPFLR